MFGVAVLLALLKLGGFPGPGPLFLKMVPTTPAAKAAKPVAGEALADKALELPDAEGPTPGSIGGLLTITSRVSNPSDRGDSARNEDLSRDETPVFHRPSSGESPDDGPVCGNLGDFPKSSKVVFPLSAEYFGSYEDTWGAARPQGGHEGTDLMSPTGTPEFATTDGTIVPVRRSNESGWNRLGGYTVMLQAAYDAGPIRKGDLFYYAHMDQESALPIGTKVRAGQQIGQVGDTGEGREGTRGKFPSHLHLDWYDAGFANGSRTNLQSGAMNPYPLLLWLEQYGGAVTGATDASYCEVGEPVPDSPRTSADLDTGYQNDTRPSPTVGETGHAHPPEQESAREYAPENTELVEAETAGATHEVQEAELRVDRAGKPEDDRAEDRSTKPSAPDQPESAPISEETSPPSGESGSMDTGVQEQVRSQPPAPWQPDQVPSSSYPSILTNAFGEVAGNFKQDDNKTDEKKRKSKKKKNLEPPESGESGDKWLDEERLVVPGKPEEPGDASAPRPGPVKTNDGSRCATPWGGLSKEHCVYITRAQRLQDSKETTIGYDDWLKVVEADPELRMRGAAEIKTTAGKTLRYENKGLAVWTAHSTCKRIWFDLRGGKVVVEDPDEATIEKMRDIAGALGARVRTADGEEP